MYYEAYVKLADKSDVHFENRLHFFAVAAKAMRHVYLDYAKRKNAQKRGAWVPHVMQAAAPRTRLEVPPLPAHGSLLGGEEMIVADIRPPPRRVGGCRLVAAGARVRCPLGGGYPRAFDLLQLGDAHL
ncbi:MAG: hypothetical protein IH951_12305, partial [Bacteroidetes bacterium]|nr:hypothetical protein [Bacteroidota bacterium]